MAWARWLLVPGCLLHPALLSGSRADGGTLRLSERRGDYRISVFTAPTPFRAGPVDVSVLVQHARTGEPLVQADVTVRAVQRDRPGVPVVAQATHAAATNKLFHAAVFDLPEAGWWEIEVAVAAGGEPVRVRCEVEAADAAPEWLELWPWLGWPVAVIGLFAVHQRLARRHARRWHSACTQQATPL